MTRVASACYILLLVALPARAADEVKFTETYRQRLAGAGWVDFDADFNPVFHLEAGYYFAKTGKFVKYRDGGPHAPAYFDRAGRVWVKDNKETAVHLWTGEKWEKFPYDPRHLFDDSAGRVFLFDGTHIRVFGVDGKWTAQEVSKTRRDGHIGFAEQGGRVWAWMWGHGKEYESGIGAWSLTGGKWKHYTIANGFYYQSAHAMHPLGDGRILVMDYQPPGHGRSPAYYWHPDKKLTVEEMTVSGGKLGGGGGGEAAYGTDGTLYFGNAPGGNNGWVAVDTKGKLHELTKHVGLAGLSHAVVNGRRVVFGKLGEATPVLPSSDGEFIGADRDGRFYFRPSAGGWKGYENRVTVTAVWPKHEKPGEVLRAEKEKLAVTRVVKDDVGKLWAEPVYGGALLQRHSGKWIDTPVQPLFHPVWTARPASPWSRWTWNSAHLFRLHGKNGSVLVVRIRDVYQIDEPPNGERVPPRPIVDRDFPHPAPPPPVPGNGEKALYWLETYLFRDGKWSGPTEIRKLLATESAALLSDFPTGGGYNLYFSFVNDGTRLWAAFDGKVLTSDKTGKVIEADWPREKPKTPLPFVMLSRLPGGKVLLSGTLNDGHALSLSPEGKITTEDFLMPGNNPAANPNEVRAHWKFAKDETLWYWTATHHGLGCLVWHYREGKWTEKKGVGVPVHEDANGDVWCLPTSPNEAKFSLFVVNGKETREVPFAEEQPLGFTDAPKGSAVWAWGGWLYLLEPGAKPVLRRRLLSERVYGYAPAVIDDKGTVLFDGFRGSLK